MHRPSKFGCSCTLQNVTRISMSNRPHLEEFGSYSTVNGMARKKKCDFQSHNMLVEKMVQNLAITPYIGRYAFD